jgi:hypothetical protein
MATHDRIDAVLVRWLGAWVEGICERPVPVVSTLLGVIG